MRRTRATTAGSPTNNTGENGDERNNTISTTPARYNNSNRDEGELQDTSPANSRIRGGRGGRGGRPQTTPRRRKRKNKGKDQQQESNIISPLRPLPPNFNKEEDEEDEDDEDQPSPQRKTGKTSSNNPPLPSISDSNTNNKEPSKNSSGPTPPPRTSTPRTMTNRSTENDNDDASTATAQAQNGPTEIISRNRTAFFNLRLKLASSSNSLETLNKKCKDVITKIKETEGTAVLCIYSTDNFNDAINLANQLPTTLASLRKYFNKIYPITKGGYTWASIRLGFDCETHALARDLKDPLDGIDVTIYVKKLQKGETSKPYWLQFLSPEVDIPYFQEWFTTATHSEARKQGLRATAAEANIEIGLIAHPINDGFKKNYEASSSSYSYNIEKNVGVHVILETKFVEHGGKLLCNALKSDEFKLQYGIEVRLCPVITREQGARTKEKIRRYMKKHQLYMYNLTSRSRNGIATLDTVDPTINMPLRQLAMLEQNSEGNAIFTAVGRSINRGEEEKAIKFIFPKAWEDEAIRRMRGLGQYLVMTHGNAVKQFFTLEEQERINSSKVDGNGDVIFWEDELVQDDDDDDNNPDWVVDKLPSDFQRPAATTATTNPPHERPTTAPPPFRASGDDESLDTWGSDIHQAANERNDTATTSGRSTYSAITIESRMSTLEASVQSQAASMQSIKSTLGELATFLSNLRSTDTSTQAETNGSLTQSQNPTSSGAPSEDNQG